MRFRPFSLLAVPLFASLLMGPVQSFAASVAISKLEELRPGSLLVFTRDMELDTERGTINIDFKSTSGWGLGTNAACFFIAAKGDATSLAESGSIWRLASPPRAGWNDYLAIFDSMTDRRQLALICRVGQGEKIPLKEFLEAFTNAGIQINAPMSNRGR